MVRRVITHLIDDIDGGEGDETVAFGLDGTEFEIDLSTMNAAKLRESLLPFINAARRVGRTDHRGRSVRVLSTVPQRSEENDRIRAWANRMGLPVAARGRIAQSVIDQYRAGSNGQPAPTADIPVEAPATPASRGRGRPGRGTGEQAAAARAPRTKATSPGPKRGRGK